MKYYIQKIQNGQHYKKNELEFDYVSPKTFKEIKDMQQFQVIGAIKLEETRKQNVDIVEINSFQFEIKKDYKESKLLGYISIGGNNFIAVEKNSNTLIPIIIFIILGIFIVIGVTSFKPNSNSNKIEKPTLEFEEGEDWDGDMPSNGQQSEGSSESIEIPGYSNLYVSSESPEILLINPDKNTVYFVYTISKDNEVIYETKAIAPNKTISVNFKELLPVGEHDLTFQISTYDIETQAPCNGATQKVSMTIQE